jgi:hypothetical protein
MRTVKTKLFCCYNEVCLCFGCICSSNFTCN